jgi:flagellar FliL protein
MAVNRLEQNKPTGEAPRQNGEALPASAGEPAAVAPAKAASKSALAAWGPMLAGVVLMPAVAYGVSIYLILPKLQPASAKAGAAAAPAAIAEAENTAAKESAAKAKILAPLSGKLLVNLAGSMGTRYLMANVTLVGSGPLFKETVEKNDAQLRDVAASTLAGKTIADLEKPGARNLIRAELISVFNEALGKGVVGEIYLTEFAIQ